MSAPRPVRPSATPRVPRPLLTLHRQSPAPRAASRAGLDVPASMCRRSALAAFLAEPESRRSSATLLATLDRIDRAPGVRLLR